MESTTVNFGQTPLDINKLIQFLTTPEAWDKERITDFEEWREAYQLLVTKIRNGDFNITFPNSTGMIGNASDRFDILKGNPNHGLTDKDWRAWYNGWMEGRFDILGKLVRPLPEAAKVDISLPGIKRLPPEEWEKIQNKLGKNRTG
jgi:hypothetical protein